ncbi:MAG: hypothetical protein GX285_04510, partial [Clostridiales bacterium]|nr:hypothetical protein [Clostridiales bacterium]
ETTDMIDDSIKQVEEGYIIANDTADALNKIVLGVTDVGEIVEYIAQASKEQNSAITEINIGIEQISQVIQNNTATAEESASASEEMAGQSQMLKEMIQQFKLKGMSQKSNNNPQKIQEIKKPNYRLNTIVLDDEGFGKY